jgi:hypothetical protein
MKRTSLRRNLGKIALTVTPQPIWNAYLRTRGLPQTYRWRAFGKMQTCADAAPLLDGRFTEIHDRFCDLNPFNGEGFRYPHYNACFFASMCRHIPGDFVSAGVTFGATAKIVYEFVDFPTLRKTFHLIDPFEGTVDYTGRTADNYNRDPDYVLRQYPPGAPVVLHRKRVPLRLPGPLAFVITDTGHVEAAAESLPIFYDALSPGGMIVAFEYGQNTALYAPLVQRLGITPLWLPSGQAVFVKQSAV